MPLSLLSYGRQMIDEDDIASVCAVLRSDWLTTGPAVESFEKMLAHEVGAKHAVVCNSGTAALYLTLRALELEPGDAVIVPAITFVATASAAILAGLEVIFADVDPETGLMNTEHVTDALRRGGRQRVKAVLPVHLAGRVADAPALHALAKDRGLAVIEDACHALGTCYDSGAHRVGGCDHALAACFSFHPVKSIAMGEGGAVTTNSPAIAQRVRLLRNHGMSKEPGDMVNRDLAFAMDGALNPWYYEVGEPSHNFRASDINSALGLSQLRKLGTFLATRRKLIARYAARLAALGPAVRLIPAAPGTEPGWHLCAVLVDFDLLGIERRELMARLHARGVGTQVHYIPVHKQPFYRRRYGEIDLPGAWEFYRRTLTLPLFAAMSEVDVDRVVDALAESIAGAR
jgi:UDP-4-amino-4,6-dideoxy-N-acetyl-beta-L-altrosamine transaminase